MKTYNEFVNEAKSSKDNLNKDVKKFIDNNYKKISDVTYDFIISEYKKRAGTKYNKIPDFSATDSKDYIIDKVIDDFVLLRKNSKRIFK